jgi:hypothetical protein
MIVSTPEPFVQKVRRSQADRRLGLHGRTGHNFSGRGAANRVTLQSIAAADLLHHRWYTSGRD